MSKARILAVDDQRYFRELTEGLLGDAGYEVQTADSGEEALHILEREDFEVVLTDLVMPGIDGTELVRRIKERLPEQDVVMVTGVVDVKTAVETMKMGATDYILKPFDRTALTNSIEKILQRRRLRDEHSRLMEENLEFMGVLSLFERAAGLFSTLSVEPLAERLVEGLCLETRTQSGVLWVAQDRGATAFHLVGARGLIRVEDEPEIVELDEIQRSWCPGLETLRSAVSVASVESASEDAGAEVGEEAARETMYVPIRVGSDTIGLARLTDKLDGERFVDSDRAIAEKFCDFGATALDNAMRFRALERRSLRDPDTRAYTREYFQDAVRNEIQKANRFGHRFSVLQIDLDPTLHLAGTLPERTAAQLEEAQWVVSQIEGVLRSTDLLASSRDGTYQILLPQTDGLGAGMLCQRIRSALAAAIDDSGPTGLLRISSATFPVDGTQLDALDRVLAERVQQSRESLLTTRPDLARAQPFDPLLDRMLELGTVETTELEGQILRFVLEDVMRRPADRGVLFLSPGARWLPEVLETLHEIRGRESRTDIVLLAEGTDTEETPGVTWITKSALDSRRPFVVYFGDGPAYAMIGQMTVAASRVPIFQTADRALVEHLAFELQRELGILISI